MRKIGSTTDPVTERERERFGERSLTGAQFVVMGLTWFLSQLKTKSAETDLHTHIKMHTHLLQSYFMYKL